MKKKFLVSLLVVAVLLGLYWGLGGLDAAHPAPPDLDTGDTPAAVSDDNNWCLALAAATNLVSLSEDEWNFVLQARMRSTSWWTRVMPPVADEAEAWDRIDGILARHDGLFAHLAAHAHCTGWQYPPSAFESPETPFLVRSGFTLSSPVVSLFDLKIERAVAHDDLAAALRDLFTLESLSAAAHKGAINLAYWCYHKAVWNRACGRVLTRVADLDAAQLELLQELVDSAARDVEVSGAQAYARGVQQLEARWNWFFRRDGFAVLMAQLTKLGDLAAKALHEVAERNRQMLDPKAERTVAAQPAAPAKDASARPPVSRFSFHFNRSLAAVYEESCATHACLLRGHYDMSLRALDERLQEPEGWLRYVSPLLPNAVGRQAVRTARKERVTSCTMQAKEMFSLAAARVIVAANRFRRATGAYPLALEELVPDYLPAVPQDPFGDGPIGYNVQQRTLHSVGEAGSFDGVLPPNGVRGLYYVDKAGVRHWQNWAIRRLDGRPLKESQPPDP